MNNIRNVLLQIINKENLFCCLCLQTVDVDRSEIDDVVSLRVHNLQKHMKLSDIISYVLGDKVATDVSGFNTLCSHCTTSLINAYKFIKSTKENIQHLANIIDHFHCSFNVCPQYMDGCETLFITHDTISNSSNHYFDHIGAIDSTSEALERLKTLENNYKPKKTMFNYMNMFVISPEEDEVTKSTKNKISTMDMIVNNDTNSLQCKDCFKEFSSASNLRNHFLRMHVPKEYKCPLCPKNFSTTAFLKAHRAESHINMVCSDCGKTFNNIHTLRRHEVGHNLRLVCQDCGRVYKNKTTFRKHVEHKVCQMPVRHSPADAKFECDYCQKRYTQKMSLRVHIQYEHGNYKSHVCKWCNKKFWCQSRLKAHIVKHTKEKNFICTICSGKFVTKESLLYHTRIHTGERPYKCPLCDSRFLSASRRAAHVQSQHTDPTVECDICHSKFKSVNYLLKHKKIHEKPELKTELYVETDARNQENELQSIKMDIGVQGDLNKDGQEHKNVYYIAEDTVMKIEDIPDSSKKVEYYFIDKIDGTSAQPIDENTQIYFEVTDDGHYDIKVSENVEV